MPADSLPAPDETLAPLAAHESLLLAVSGGPDSVALMLLCEQWSERANKRIAVATVDHGLRPEAAEEARQTARWAADLGFSHRTLRWEGEKPKTRIQERAREARYRLLCGCAREIGATAIVTAHHADDQAETILFRLARGSGVAGLAGMAVCSQIDGLALLRPLLGLRKSELEALCAARGQEVLRDPSNENPAFARVRLRRLAALLEAQGLDREGLLRLGVRAARAEEALVWSAREAARALPAEREERHFRAAAGPLRALPREILQRIVLEEITRIAAGAPRLERLERAVDGLARALVEEEPFTTTLGGASIALSNGNVTIAPQPPRRKRTTPRDDAA
jgi:tRNA(Ile)-lysidine synthase